MSRRSASREITPLGPGATVAPPEAAPAAEEWGRGGVLKEDDGLGAAPGMNDGRAGGPCDPNIAAIDRPGRAS